MTAENFEKLKMCIEKIFIVARVRIDKWQYINAVKDLEEIRGLYDKHLMSDKLTFEQKQQIWLHYENGLHLTMNSRDYGNSSFLIKCCEEFYSDLLKSEYKIEIVHRKFEGYDYRPDNNDNWIY